MHSDQHQVTRTALDERTDCGGVALAFDEIAFPVAGCQTVFGIRRAHMNADKIRDLTTAIYSTRARAATGFALTQANDQLLAKLAHRQRVDGVVDGLAADVHVFKLWKFHASKFAGNLLGRKALSQQVDHKVEQFCT